MNFDRRPASAIPMLMNTSNRDLREVFNWDSPLMREIAWRREGGGEEKERGGRNHRCCGGGGGGKGEQRSACMIFQYCRSTLSPIFAADCISLLPYPNLRDRFTTAARSGLREAVPLSLYLSQLEQIGLCAALARPAERGREGRGEGCGREERREERDPVNFISVLIHFDPRDRFGYHWTISARISRRS